MNEITTVSPVIALIPENMDQAIRLAQAMSSAKMVPAHLQGDVGSCLMVIEQAMRWRASPFAVAQCTSNIGGKHCYEGKLIAAILPSAGAIVGELDYTYDGDAKQPETLSVTVSGKRASDGEIKSLTLSWLDAKTKNAYWTSQPEQQLCYAGARVWARRWTPGPLLGIYAPEEMAAERKAVKEAEHNGPPLEATPEREAINAEVPLRAAAAPMPRGAKISERAPAYEASPPDTPRQRTRRDFLDGLAIALRDAQSAEEVDRLLCGEETMRAKESFRNGHLDELNRLIADALAKWYVEPTEDDEVHIKGEENLAAG
jgi:hypothetical protein